MYVLSLKVQNELVFFNHPLMEILFFVTFVETTTALNRPMKVYTMKLKWLLCGGLMFLLTACGKQKEAQGNIDSYPPIFPDYTFTAIPYNIAPLNFKINDAQSIRADFCSGGATLLSVSGDHEIEIPQDQWRKLLEQQKGKELEVRVSVWNASHPEGIRYKSFNVYIAPDPIDEWIAYRLIEPGYEGWKQMGIYQRNLTSFEEKEIATNHEDTKTCVNCHSFAGYSPKRMLFHVRGANGGTALWMDGNLSKLELDKIGPKKSGTYPMWHPQGRYIVFSSNLTRQSFLSEGRKPLEVYDLESDLILYDTQTKQVLTDPRFMGDTAWETFPAWAPDGKSLYYCVARPVTMPVEYDQLHYSLCKVDFDEATGKFGERVDTIYHADQKGGSVSFPRISPDGNYLLYTLSANATFPIWHKEADLKLFDLRNGQEIDASILNSDESESYHSWSSNGRWILFSSRRLDGRYTRLFMAWLDGKGQVHKPFLLPQQNPEHNILRMKSYNIPEFIKEEVVLPEAAFKDLFFQVK